MAAFGGHPHFGLLAARQRLDGGTAELHNLGTPTHSSARRTTCSRLQSPYSDFDVTGLRLEALAWPRFQSIECGLLASPLTLPTAPATYNMSSGGSQTLPNAHCMPPYRWRSKCCGRMPMTEDMSTRPRPRLRAARLTLGRWCALQAVRRTAVAPEPTGASAEGSSPAPLLCDVLSPFGSVKLMLVLKYMFFFSILFLLGMVSLQFVSSA